MKPTVLISSSLQTFDNVIITPHIGTFTKETATNMDIRSAEAVLKILNC